VKTWRAYLLLLGPILLLGLALWLLALPSRGTFAITGTLSPSDAQALRREIGRVQRRALGYSICHWRFRSLWDDIRVIRTCRLTAVDSYDGKTASAIFHGRSWDGNDVTIQYVFTNRTGAWSCTTVGRAEAVTTKK